MDLEKHIDLRIMRSTRVCNVKRLRSIWVLELTIIYACLSQCL